MPIMGSTGLKVGRMFGGVVAVHPASDSDASIANNAVFIDAPETDKHSGSAG
jgi:hypothetical protein